MASNDVLNEIVAEEKLFEIWPDHPCLYDVRSADFKNRDRRQKALEEIAIAVNQNVDWVKNKLKALRNCFTKAKKPPPSGSAMRNPSKQTTWVLDKLQFLEQFIATRSTMSNLDEFLLPESESAVHNNNNDNDMQHNINSNNTNVESSNNETNACTDTNTLISETPEVNPPANTRESEDITSHSQVLVEDKMTEALMVELMKDDNQIDMQTDPITEQMLLGPDDDNINHDTATNNNTQDSSDSNGLEGLTQKTPDITRKHHPSNTNYVNLDTNQTRNIINSIPNNLHRTFYGIE
ncbi:Hypothetical predicted protein [Paramuricea clavata]|uniref:Uncharacterized protein n=1 Tax=Paramuricea clavata TaxID=317549 RepID=A0A6S7G3P4_PARCT|nr:Hypothetical predicted protein [Paramuricea clavata]